MNSQPSTHRQQNLKIAAMFCLLDIILTGGAALSSNSLTILSDFFKESADFISVFFALLTLRVVNRHPNEKFSYGVGKLENLVSIGVAILMLLSALFIIYQAFARIANPEHPHGTIPGILIFSVSAVFSYFMYLRNQTLLKLQKSAIVESQVSLWYSKAWLDGLMTTSLLAGIVLKGYSWSAYLDPIVSLMGAGLLLYGAWEVSTSSVNDLLDASLEEASQLLIMRKLAEHFDDFESVLKIRTRHSGTNIYIEIFLGFNADMTLMMVQEKMRHIANDIQNNFLGAEVVIVPSVAE